MASTASTSLRLELMATGENDATWGTKNNTNLGMIENAVAGTTAISTTGGTTTLTNVDYVDDQAKKAVLDVSGVLVSNATIVIPNASRLYRVFNRTSGAFTLTVKTASGSGITITQSTVAEVYCNAADVVRFASPISDYTTGAPATSSGAAASSVSVTPTGNLSSTNAQAALAELQGDVDAINTNLTNNYQPKDSDLTAIAALASTKGNMIVGGASGWSALTVGTDGYAQVADSASASGTKWAALVPVGTVALFYQAAAPTGWTVSDADSDKAIRIVSGASGLGGAAGGTTAFSSVFAARTIAQANLPNVTLTGTAASDGAHTHTYVAENIRYSQAGQTAWGFDSDSMTTTANYTIPSDGAHTHSVTTSSINGGVAQTTMDFATQYISVIKAAKAAY